VQRSFWANLNVFLALLVLVAGVGAFFLYVPIALVAKLVLPPQKAELYALPAAYVLIAAGLGWKWWKAGLSPAKRNPEHERRFKSGHVLLAVANVFIVAAFVPAFLAPSLLAHMKFLPAAPLAMMLPSVVPLLLIAGLVMVMTARAPATEEAAFADTVANPAQQTPPPARPRTQYAQAQPKTQGGSWAVVIVGLGASSVLIFIGLVFASLSFQGRTERFTGVVLPVAGAVFILYVTSALWLAASGHARAAVGVAWAPAALMTLGLPLLQVVAMAFAWVLGR